MRNIMELMEASKDELPEIYCDMDQVLCDFIGGAGKAIGSPFVTADKNTRWDDIAQTKDFWANLDWMPGAKRLYSFVSKYDPHILSAYSNSDDNSRRGKLKWLGKNTKIKRSNINLVKRADKQKFATTDGKPNLLIDDYLKNITEWQSKGGIGVHHTDTGKTLAELKRLGFK
jgi:5'(3')-deoxyribonucleotidase